MKNFSFVSGNLNLNKNSRWKIFLAELQFRFSLDICPILQLPLYHLIMSDTLIFEVTVGAFLV